MNNGLVLRLHAGQRIVLRAGMDHRRLVLVAGRRWGKGEVAAARLVLASLCRPEHYAYIAPTYRMARRIEWPKVLRWADDLARQTGIRYTMNRSDLVITWSTGGSVGHYGADNPDSLRGVDRGFAGVVMDEFDFFRREPGQALPYVWEAVVRPALADTGGWAQFQGTPDGFGALYTMSKRESEGVPGYKSFHFRSIDNPLLDPAEIEEARRSSDPRTFRQEWEASYETPAGRIYEDFSRQENVKPCPFDKSLPAFVGMDFNVSPMSAVIAQQHGPEVWITHAVEQQNSNSRKFGLHLRAILEEAYGGQTYPEPILWVDPSGAARQHAMGSSDVDILRGLGFRVAFKHFRSESDKFNAVRAYILNAAGERRLFIDPSCKRLIERMEQLGPDDEDDHLTDALGYLMMGQWPTASGATWR